MQFPENVDADSEKLQDVNVVSSLLKLFLRKLPDSLITDGKFQHSSACLGFLPCGIVVFIVYHLFHTIFSVSQQKIKLLRVMIIFAETELLCNFKSVANVQMYYCSQ